MSDGRKKTEVRVFLDSADLKYVDDKIGDLGSNRSQVIRQIVKDVRRKKDEGIFGGERSE